MGKRGRDNKIRIISNLVEKKTRFLYEKAVFSIGSMDRRLSVWQSGSMPEQKSIRLAKKGGGPSFPNAGFCALLPSYPFPPASLCGREEGGKWEGLIPALFVFGACSFARATRRLV